MQTTLRQTLEAEFAAAHPRAHALHERARQVLPSGLAHDVRHARPFPIYATHGEGARKWDVDGHAYIDYVMGHGALLLGHSHPAIVRAVQEQAARGTHLGACHEAEVRWAEHVARLVPSAEWVRFTSSGTEATLMAVRLARAYTGRRRLLTFERHFHGWHDAVMAHANGVPEGVREDVLCLPVDLEAVRAALETDPEIAAIILEPSGAHWGTVPLPEGFLTGLRALADRHGAVLIFDEVVTGFRWSPGGVQALAGVRPDLTALAKVLAGGLPGGAVAGRREILALLAFEEGGERPGRKIYHPGTFNANPLSAAAGVACLERVATGAPNRAANAAAAQLRARLNGVLARLGVPGCAYGAASTFHLALGVDYNPPGEADLDRPALPDAVLDRGGDPALAETLALALLQEGVHFFHLGGILSAAHDQAALDETVGAFERAVKRIGGTEYGVRS